MRAGRLATPTADLLHGDESGKDGTDPLGQPGMLVRVFGQRRPLAPAVPLQEFLGQLVDRIEFGRRVVHDLSPSSPVSAGSLASGRAVQAL